jgi:hypothetical protein
MAAMETETGSKRQNIASGGGVLMFATLTYLLLSEVAVRIAIRAPAGGKRFPS